MKIEAEITNVRTSKKGDTLTIFISKEHRAEVVKHIFPFVEKPITFEVLIDGKKTIENFNRITEEQRNKIYKLLADFSKEYGDTTENVKALLKSQYIDTVDLKELSFSDCSKETASDFIQFVLNKCNELGYAIHQEDNNYSYTQLYDLKKCFICGEQGNRYQSDGGKICLCDRHMNELKVTGTQDFMNKYHLEVI